MAPAAFFNESHLEPVERLLAKGLSYRQIAAEYGVNHVTVAKFVSRSLPEWHARRTGQHSRPATKILVIDIETMANLAWTWGTWQQNIAPSQIQQHKRTISFAAKWVGDPKIHFYSEYHDGYDAMVDAAWDLIDEADVIVGYNSKRFDIKHLNTEFKLSGLGPPSHFQHIDLYQITRREFAFGSNKLEAVAHRLGLGKKREHEGFGLWMKCERHDPKAWKRMRDYNKNDVVLTEKLFEEFRDWIPLRGTQSQKKLREVLR